MQGELFEDIAPHAYIGARLYTMRRIRRIKRNALAKALGVCTLTLRNYEYGRTPIPPARLRDLAETLQCDITALTMPGGLILPRETLR